MFNFLKIIEIKLVNYRLILNGKSATLPQVREAVKQVRLSGFSIEVRSTWEQGDASLFAQEAAQQGIDRVIAAGGDGTLHEVMNGLMQVDQEQRPEMSIVPLGTANDFARSCNIPLDTQLALQLAVQGKPCCIDVGKMNEDYFLNMATAGFGAEVTVSTPTELKKLLGGAAYSIMGLLLAFNFKPYEGNVRLPNHNYPTTAVVGAIGNGRQAGGGKVLAPKAFLDDGLLDMMILHEFSSVDIPQVALELQDLSEQGQFISYFQTPWVEFEHLRSIPINLDGEARQLTHARVEVIPAALNIILPENCQLLKNHQT